MKIIVVSDNHGDRNVLISIANQYRGQVDKIFHCGDSELDELDSVWEDMVTVKGNCDYGVDYPNELVETIDGQTIFMTHGHLYNIKMTLDPVIAAAKKFKANYVFFGHSHELGVEMREGMLLLNPGSIRLPRGKYASTKTYAMIEDNGQDIIVTYYNEKHEAVPGLTFKFQH